MGGSRTYIRAEYFHPITFIIAVKSGPGGVAAETQGSWKLLLENRAAQPHPSGPSPQILPQLLSGAKAGLSLPFPPARSSRAFPQPTRAFPSYFSSLFMFSKDMLTFKAFPCSSHIP